MKGALEPFQRKEIDVMRRKNTVGMFPQCLDVPTIHTKRAYQNMTPGPDQTGKDSDKSNRVVDMFQHLEADREIAIAVIAANIFNNVFHHPETAVAADC